MTRLAALVFGVCALGLAGAASADDKKDGKGDAAGKLVGRWEVTKSGSELPAGSLVEFTKDGKMAVVVKDGRQQLKLEGTYKLDKDKLTVKLKVGDKGPEETVIVKKLTDDALEVEDKDKKVDVLKRVAEKKK